MRSVTAVREVTVPIRSFLAFMLLCTGLGAATAQHAAPRLHAVPASVESVEQLLLITRAPELVETMRADTEASLGLATPRHLPDPVLTERQRIARERLSMRLRILVHDELSWERLKPEFVRVYRETFEQAEVDGLLAFYRTPVGQAYVAKLPALSRRSSALAKVTMERLMPKVQALRDESMRETGARK